MKENMQNYDLSRLDSSVINLNTPDWLARKFIDQLLDNNKDSEENSKCIADFDEDKIRLTINAVVAANLINPNDRPGWAKQALDWPRSDFNSNNASVHKTSSGIRYTKLNGCLLFLLPDIKTAADTDSVIESLNDLVEVERQSSDWVIDVFNLNPIPEKLLAYLIGFQRGLQSSAQNHLSLLWLRKDAIPDYMLPALSKHFQAVKKGSFLISRL